MSLWKSNFSSFVLDRRVPSKPMCTDKQELHPLQKETPKLCDIIWWKECHWLVALETWLCRMLQEQDHENGEMSHSLLWSSSEKMYRQGQPRWVSHFDLCVTHSCVDYTTCLKSWNHFLCLFINIILFIFRRYWRNLQTEPQSHFAEER